MCKGKLFVVSGPSGAGKGTICKELLKEVKASLSVSMTTRKPRPGEVNGKSYNFISEQEFEHVIESGGFLEYAKVYENYYGTPRQKVLEELDRGNDVILEIDIQGALKVKEHYTDGVFVFILPPSIGELRKRIEGRGSETNEKIELRMREALKEATYINKYDYCVINSELVEAVANVKAIIRAEHLRVSSTVYELIESYKGEL